ncbi:His/Gly/Thr/Pro-type tRNA ligase C-terminal domain-containing protein, partial [Streptomyces carpinensis]|uniref:His/Gly/Thr/Pro-type tRNA ligase C-terminal domain-containing protein n=1 Tax=Streptomyces carpinensis TaxID=66369 RepID=UPI001FCA4782
RLAPVQAVVVAVKDDDAVQARVREIGERLTAAGVRAHVDDRTDTPFGRRVVDWELKGVPVRIEVGPRDLEQGTAVLVRRIAGSKEPTAIGALSELLPKMLADDQALLLTQSRERRESRTAEVTTIAEATEAATTGWARIPWAALGPEGEAQLAEQGVSVRCLVAADGSVPESDDQPGNVAVVARAY